jgi:NarL family two-component system response regulator LiaR
VIRILIVDDSPVIRKSLRTLFSAQPDWTICGEAENGADAIDKAQTLHPDLIIIDLVMPILNGIDATRLLKRLLPTTPVLMFTTFTAPHLKDAALAAGVRAVIDKMEGGTTLIDSIEGLFVAETPPVRSRQQKQWKKPTEGDKHQAEARQSYRSRETDSADGFAEGLKLFTGKNQAAEKKKE